MTIGEAIRHVRQQNALTQTEVAKRAGIPRTHVLKIEQDKVNPSINTFDRLAVAMQVKASYILRIWEGEDL